MKHTVGKAFLPGSGIEIFTVPNGYIAVVYMVFITNTSGSTNSYDLTWVHSHGHNIRFAYGKSLGSGTSDQFTNGELVMKAGDSMTITNSGNMDVIVTFDLLQAPPLYTFAGE